MVTCGAIARHFCHRRRLWCLGACLAALAAGCESSASECQSERDCKPRERCVSTGGIFFRGGRCVVEVESPPDTSVSPDTGVTDAGLTDCDSRSGGVCDVATDAGAGDTGGDVVDGRAADTGEVADTTPRDTVADSGRQTSDSAGDTGPATYCHETGDRRKPCIHRIAVTNLAVAASFGKAGDLGNLCSFHAKGRGGRWQRVVATAITSIEAGIRIRGPVVNLQGDLVATSASDFWDGSIRNPVLYDFQGRRRSVEFWTGASLPNTPFDRRTCRDWTSNARRLRGTVGSSDAVRGWLRTTVVRCHNKAHLLCIDGQ